MISDNELSKLGININNIYTVETINELRKTLPHYVIAECVHNLEFSFDNSDKQHLKKKNKYILSLGNYDKIKEYRNIKYLKPADIKFKNLFKPYNNENLDNKNLLVVRYGGLGDLLFIQPNLIYLKEKYPTCKITVCCGHRMKPLVKLWECVDEIIAIPFNFQQLLKYDYHCFFEGVIERTKEAENVNAYELFTKWLNINLPKEKLIPKLIPDKNITDEVKNIIWNTFDIRENEFIVIQLEASSIVRTPDLIKFWKPLISKLLNLNYKIVITDSPYKNKKIDNFIENNFNDIEKLSLFNFSTFSKSIDYTISLISLCRLTIGPDSSINHITAALNKPLFAIFGAFKGELRLGTYDTSKTKWIDYKLDCGPCFDHHNICKNLNENKYPKCYNNILNLNKIIETIIELYN